MGGRYAGRTSIAKISVCRKTAMGKKIYRDDPIASWRRMGVTLTGDAAHMMPPHLAQGAFTGIFEDISMSWRAIGDKGFKSASLRSMAIDRAGQLNPVS